MAEFTCLPGEPALSEFRLRKLHREAARAMGDVAASLQLSARYVYFVSSETALEGA